MNVSFAYADEGHPNYFSPENQEQAFVTFCVYALQGIVLLLTNLPVVVAILVNKGLRKNQEYTFVAGLSLADSFTGLGCLLSGIGRNLIIWRGDANRLLSRWQCAVQPWNLLSFNFCEVLASLMLLAISLDRLFMVSRPITYATKAKQYSYPLRIVITVYGVSGLIAAYILIGSYMFNQEPEFPAICYGAWAQPSTLGGDFYKIYFELKIWPETLSVFIYFAAMVLFWKSVKPSVAPSRWSTNSISSVKTAQQVQLERQRRFTITMGISSVFTLVLMVLPVRVHMYAHYALPTGLGAVISGYSYVINNCNPIVNFFIYTARHSDLRRCIVSVFKGQQYHGESTGPPVAAVQR